MNCRINFKSIIACILAVILIMSCCAYASVMYAPMPDRVPLRIYENVTVEKDSSGELVALAYPSDEYIEISGVLDADFETVFSVNGIDAAAAGCEMTVDKYGKWICLIPFSVLNADIDNIFRISYADREADSAVCIIYVDDVCSLEISPVYYSETAVSGKTDPFAEVVLYADGASVYATKADEAGNFVLEYDISAAPSCVYEVSACDFGGNSAYLPVEVLAADISVEAPAYTGEDHADILITAVPASLVQLIVDGVPYGEAVLTDDNGIAVITAEGLKDGASYEVTAAYADRFSSAAYSADTVYIVSDMSAPVLASDIAYLDVNSESITVFVSEDCSLVMSEASTGFERVIECKAGENTIVFDDDEEFLYPAFGMELAFRAVDAAGNESDTLLYAILPDDEDVLFAEGFDFGAVTVFDAMEPVDISGSLYVGSCDHTLVITVTGEDFVYNPAEMPFEAEVSEAGAILPAVIHFEMQIPRTALPAGEELSVEFTVLGKEGAPVYGTERLALVFMQEKEPRWLVVRIVLMCAVLLIFGIFLWLHRKAEAKQRVIRRNNGIRRRRRIGKRGGAWD